MTFKKAAKAPGKTIALTPLDFGEEDAEKWSGVQAPVDKPIRCVYSDAMTPRNVRRLRQRLGLSQTGFAGLVGVTPNTVARWERGELGMRPTTAHLIRLVTAQSPHQRTKTRKA